MRGHFGSEPAVSPRGRYYCSPILDIELSVVATAISRFWTIFVGIESYDNYAAMIYRQVSYASFDTRYIEVSRYHDVSVSNVHKYRDTLIYRVSNRHYRACM